MFKKVKNAGKALKNIGTRSFARHSSQPSEMSVDPTPTQAPSSSSGQQVKALLKIGDLGLKTRREKEVYQQLKNKDSFTLLLSIQSYYEKQEWTLILLNFSNDGLDKFLEYN